MKNWRKIVYTYINEVNNRKNAIVFKKKLKKILKNEDEIGKNQEKRNWIEIKVRKKQKNKYDEK